MITHEVIHKGVLRVAVVTEPGQRCGAMETTSGHDVISPRNSINVITRADGYIASSVTMETGRGGPSCPWHIQVMRKT